jgi:hypothetical protein
MVAVGIISIVFALAPRAMTDVFKFFRLALVRAEIQRDARGAVDLVNRRLRQAEATTVVVDSDTGQPPYSRVQFRTIAGSTVTFWQSGTQLMMREQPKAARLLAPNLRHVAFIYKETDNDKIMSVSVTLEKDVYAGKSKALQMAVEKVRIMND